MRPRFWHVVGVVGIATLVAPVLGEPVDAAKILKKAQAAVRDVHSVLYRARLEAEGGLANTFHNQRADVTLAQTADGMPKVRIESLGDAAGRELICDGEVVCLLDRKKKEYALAHGRSAKRLLARRGVLMLREFIDDDPFEHDLGEGTPTYVGTEKVAGVNCDVVKTTHAGGKMEVRWYIGKTDGLPRRTERILANDVGGGGKLVITLEDLAPNLAIDEERFATAPPAGYERTVAPGQPKPLSRKDLEPSLGGTEKGDELARMRRVERKLLEVGSMAPDWSLKTPEGKTVTLSGLRGKVVVLNFWATWSRDCRAALPEMQKLHEHYEGKPVVVYGISALEPGDPASFLESKHMTVGLLLEGDTVAVEYGVKDMPVFYVIGADGKVLYAAAGRGKETKIKEVVDETLKAAGD